jgi:hypothetical protein
MNNFYGSIRNNFYPSQTGNQEMIYVPATTYSKAIENWIRENCFYRDGSHFEMFHQELGITEAQINHANSKPKPFLGLTVSTATAKKLEILAAGNLEHYKTLFKVIDARY